MVGTWLHHTYTYELKPAAAPEERGEEGRAAAPAPAVATTPATHCWACDGSGEASKCVDCAPDGGLTLAKGAPDGGLTLEPDGGLTLEPLFDVSVK